MNVKMSRPKVNARALMALVISSILVFAGFLSFSSWSSVRANTPDINNTRARYPMMVGSRIDSCSFCHTGSIPSLNSYGSAYKSAGRSPAALAAIEGKDADGDGFTNLLELTSLTFPGDSAGHPVAPTATKLPPSATNLPPTLTPGPGQPTATIVPPGPKDPPICVTHDYHRKSEKAKNKKCEIENDHEGDPTVQPTHRPSDNDHKSDPTAGPKGHPTDRPKDGVKHHPSPTSTLIVTPIGKPHHERKHPTHGKHG